MVARIGDLAQQCAGHVAAGSGAQYLADPVLQAPPLAGDGAGRETVETAPERKHFAHPKLEPERCRIVTDLQGIGDIAHHLGRPAERCLVQHDPRRAEYPVLGVDALDPHPGLVTGHGGGRAQARQDQGFLCVECRLRPIEVIAARALTDRQTKDIGEHRLQPLVGDMLDVLQIKRQRLDIWPERRARLRRSFYPRAASRTSARQPLAVGYNRCDRRQINRIMGPDHRAQGIRREPMPTTGAAGRAMLDDPIRLFGQGAEAALVTGLGPARLRTGPLLLVICRRRLQ